MPLVTAGVVTVFGGLTLWLQDETFIKMKPTIIQGIFAAVLLGGLALGKPLLKPLLGKMMPPMTDAGWRGLTLRYGLFFIAMAVLNEIVWRTQIDRFLGELQGVRPHGPDHRLHHAANALHEPSHGRCVGQR